MSYQNHDFVAVLAWHGQADRVLQDAAWVLEDRDDSTNRLEVTVPLSQARGLKVEQELIFRNRRFIVCEPVRTRSDDRAVIVADEAQVELGGRVLLDFEFNSWTAFQALEWALKDTRWSAGEVQNVRFGRAQFEDITVLEACHFLARHQDAVVSFDSLRRRVNLTATRGTVHDNMVFTYGRQLKNIEKTEKAPTTTRIYPTGADDMTIASVNGGVEYVEDFSYYTSQGVSLADARLNYMKEDYWADSRYEVPENLKRDALDRLKTEAHPQITYTLSAMPTYADDGVDPMGLPEVGLGDRVHVWDDEIETKIVAEVTAVRTSSDRGTNEITLSYLPESLSSPGRGSGHYFGDSGSTGDHPLFPRSGFQPRPSMPILEDLSGIGVGVVRWNGQDHDGNYDTIPVRFGSVIPRAVRIPESGVIPSPDSDGVFEGAPIHSRGGGLSTIAFGGPGEYAVWFYMLGQDQNTKSEYSQALVVDVSGLVDVGQIQQDLDAARQELDDALVEWDQGQQELDDRINELNNEIIPQLEQDLQQAEAQLSQSMTTLDGKLDNLNDTVIPAIEQALTTGLDGARDELQDLDYQLRDHFGTRLDNVLAAIRGGGQTWSQNDMPPAGNTYEWVAESHDSPSVMRLNGDVVTRNLFTNPSFEGLIQPTSVSSVFTLATTTWEPRVVAGDRALIITAQANGDGFSTVSEAFTLPAGSAGQYMGVKVHNFQAVGFAGGMKARIGYYVGGSYQLSPMSDFYPAHSADGGTTYEYVSQVPAGATLGRLYLYPRGVGDGNPVAGQQWTTDGWQAVVAGSQADASDLLTDYWDGDTPDDRANDVWINGEGTQHRWDSNTKQWTAFTNEQIQQAIDSLTAQVDSVITMAGSKNSVAYHTGPPTVDGVAPGDMWRQRSANGTVTGRWYWTGTRWQLEQITSEVIDNLDAGKITAGTAAIDQGFIQKLMVDGLTARIATLAQAVVAAQNLIPGMVDIRDTMPPPFAGGGFGRNTGHPSIWIQGGTGQGARAVTTSPAPDAVIRLNAGEEYRFDVGASGSVAGTRYYVQLRHEDGSSANGTVVDGTTTSYLLSNAEAGSGPNSPIWQSSTFVPPETGNYVLQFYANHSNGAANPEGYQWFRGLSIRSLVDGSMIVENSITSRTLNTLEIFSNSAVINEIWSRVVRTGLLEANEALIGGTLIRDNAITARTVNVNSVFGDTAVLNKIFAEIVTTRLLNAGQAVIGGALIRDHQITVDHLVGLESILTELLRAKKIEAGDIDANAINGMTIAGGVVSGGRVEGAAIIGGYVNVGPRYTSGGSAGIQLASNGVFRAYDSAGNLHTVIDGANNRFTGRVSTARPGLPGLLLEPASSNASRPGIFFSSDGSASGNHGGVFTDNLWQTVIRGRRTSTGAQRNRILVEGGFYITEGRLTSDVESTFTSGINVSGSGNSNFYNRSYFHERLYNPGYSTTTIAANVCLEAVSGNPNSFFWKTSSLRKLKVNIRDLDYGAKILDLQPRTWVDRAQAEEALGKDALTDTDAGPQADEQALQDAGLDRIPGLVAEEVEALGLPGLVTYETGQDGEKKLSGVAYDRVAAALIPIIRDQRDQINALEARLTALENKE